MKNRNHFSVFTLTLILVILGLFASCADPVGPSSCTVDFNANGGSPAPNPQSIARGSKVVMPPAMTKTGYSFGGWYKEATFINQWNFASDTVTGDITLYAQWNPYTYMVNFNANGGSPAPILQYITHGGKVVMPSAMSKTGYGFGGWYQDAACTTEWIFAANSVTDNITLYAKWNVDYHTVDFEANGGNPVPDSQNIAHDGKVVMPPAMTNSGYGFGGWYKDADFVNVWNFTADNVTGNITLYAKWDLNFYTVDFNANGGNPVPPQQNITYGGKVTIPSAMNKTGYSFGGWYKEAACTNEWNFYTDSITGNITLYAKWNANYSVNFNANGGSPAPIPQSIAHGSKVDMPPAMTKTGYGFDGWYKEAACINQWNFDMDSVTGNITLYAKWNINYYTVNFSADNGNPVPSQQNIAYGGKVTIPSAMTKTGYSFGGWYKEESYINQWNFATDTIISDTTLYAKWLATYTVTFNADGGEPSPPQQIIVNGGKVSEPANISKEGYTLEGWYKDASYSSLWDFNSDTVTNDIILYAKWGPPIVVAGNTLAAKLQWLSANAKSNSSYILEVTFAQKDLTSQNIYYAGKNNITIRLKGIGSEKAIALSGSGALFSVGSGVNLILEENLVLRSGYNSISLVRVNSGGTLTMNQSVRISGNTTSSSFGGGVYVDGGTFTMSGGEISGNTASYGGGVYVRGGTFTMESGTISGNTSYGGSSVCSPSGGGVDVGGGTFTMSGGEISGNTASSSYSSSGGGVYVGNGTFTMESGTISGNTASSGVDFSSGGGVYVGGGTFTMGGGEISGNTISSSSSSSYGGGVYFSGTTFTMEGGEISGNTASSGGGVYVGNGTFTMSDGEISGNTSSSGGGVYIGGEMYSNGNNVSLFKKTGGTIYGYTAGDSRSNVVKNSSGIVQNDRGHAVYVSHSNSSYIKRKETTAEPGNNLTYIGNQTPPDWGGDWDN
jgi:uncharacterized repeat protein (TIGR02543 family)